MSRPDTKFVSLGMACLALANVSHWWLQRSGAVSEDLGDGLFGLGMGVAIGVLVLAFRRGCARTSE